MAKAEVWDGPVGIKISFGIAAPINQKHGYPKRPDLDKLVRSVLDALTGTCYRDDSQVIMLTAEKMWQPVTIIEVWRIEKQSTRSTDSQATLWTEDAEGMGKG
jgi:Holliday junction resolvase